MFVPKTIFLLEDDLQLASTIRKFLEHSGYEVHLAHDAREARDLLYESPVDLMLLDVKVPLMILSKLTGIFISISKGEKFSSL